MKNEIVETFWKCYKKNVKILKTSLKLKKMNKKNENEFRVKKRLKMCGQQNNTKSKCFGQQKKIK